MLKLEITYSSISTDGALDLTIQLQVQDGDLHGVQSFIQNTVSKFDKEIGLGIKQTTQLSLLKPSEAKGLLIAKMMTMEEKEIRCHLEIVEPVTEIGMEPSDYLRCFGIVIDNAIEEVEKIKEKEFKEVSISFYHDKQGLVFIVKNPSRDKPNLQKIWEEGYSIKGEKRGIGLMSYREITKKYPSVAIQTLWEEPYFSQILMIGI